LTCGTLSPHGFKHFKALIKFWNCSKHTYSGLNEKWLFQ
jgi:hypothetical protein